MNSIISEEKTSGFLAITGFDRIIGSVHPCAHHGLESKATCSSGNKLFHEKNKVIMLDWDDTLFPSSWMISMFVRLRKTLLNLVSVQTIFESSVVDSEEALKKHILEKKVVLYPLGLWERDDRINLRKAEQSAIALVEASLSLTPQVYIISNARLNWITSCLKTYYTRLAEILRTYNVQIFSTRANNSPCLADFSHSSLDSNALSKLRIFNGIISKMQFDELSPMQFVSIGDKDIERSASLFLAKYYSNSLNVISLKFYANSAPGLLQTQLTAATKQLETLIQSSSTLDLEFHLNDSDDSTSSTTTEFQTSVTIGENKENTR